MKQLRDMATYLEIVGVAKEDGAKEMGVLLTHVGWNSPDGLLSIHESTSLVGREAFAVVGFTEEGPTGVPIPEVLTRAARWSTVHGFGRLSRRLVSFVIAMWPDGGGGVSGNSLRPVGDAASDDVIAESSEFDEAEVLEFVLRAVGGDFSVADQHVTAKTRGSAQRMFADQVMRNYGWRCAITGLATPEFLVASHIVPWSEDELIRREPANGICLSIFVDRAFDTGFLEIHEDYSIHIDLERVGADVALRDSLKQYDGQKLAMPAASQPNPDFLRRRLRATP